MLSRCAPSAVLGTTRTRRRPIATATRTAIGLSSSLAAANLSIHPSNAPFSSSSSSNQDSDKGKGKDSSTLQAITSSLNTLSNQFTLYSTTWRRLYTELSRSPGSLYASILSTRTSATHHPEIEWDAQVRLGRETPRSENAFLVARRRKVAAALEMYLGLERGEVDERDVPVVGLACSGGGYRAMVNTLGALGGMHKSGVWDCVTYAAGISGSGWALAHLYGLGGGSIPTTTSGIKDRIRTGFLGTDTLQMLYTPPTNRALLSGLFLKEAAEGGEVSLVDLYGTAISSRLYIPDDLEKLDTSTLKLSSQRRYVEDGSMPLPIYSVVRHVLSPAQQKEAESRARDSEKEKEGVKEGESKKVNLLGWLPNLGVGKSKEKEEAKKVDGQAAVPGAKASEGMEGVAESAPGAAEGANRGGEVVKTKKKRKQKGRRDEWTEGEKWLWYEMTPFEVGCDELGAWIPTWSFGRLFDKGKNVERQPEISLTILTGIFSSAFCATMLHYYNEIKPMLSSFSYFSRLEAFALRWSKDMSEIHPFPPAQIPNFTKGLKILDTLPKDAESSSGQRVMGLVRPAENGEGKTDEKETIGLMDAGAWLNLPYLPLFRRDCDVVLALDASADSQALWFSRAGEYAKQLGIRGWPEVAGQSLVFPLDLQRASGSPASDAEKAKVEELEKIEEEKEEERKKKATELGAFNCWIGGSEKDEQGSKEAAERLINVTADEVQGKKGLALLYFPLTPGEDLKDPAGVWSTWRFEYTHEETDKLLSLAEANFNSAESQVKAILKGIWLRKKEVREREEAKAQNRIEEVQQ